jgi:hypothetical protein
MSDEVRTKRALGLYEEFISSEAKSQINLRGPTRLKLKSQLYPRSGPVQVSRDMFVNAQNEILALMATDPFRRFKSSPLFQDFLQQTKEPELSMEVPTDRDGGSPPLSPVDRRPSSGWPINGTNSNNTAAGVNGGTPSPKSAAEAKRRKSSVRTLLSGLSNANNNPANNNNNLSVTTGTSDPTSPSSANSNGSFPVTSSGTTSLRRSRTSTIGDVPPTNPNGHMVPSPMNGSGVHILPSTPSSNGQHLNSNELSPGFGRRMTKRTIINV